MAALFNIDEDPENADWLRTLRWPWPEIKDVETLRAFIVGEFGSTVEQFKTLPVYTENLEREPWLKEL